MTKDPTNTKNLIDAINKTKNKKRKPIAPERIDKLIERLPHNNFEYKKSALEAGYSPSTARQTQTLKRSVENRLKTLEERGITNEYFDIEVFKNEYEWIATQRKDIGSKLKAISPILAQHDIIPKTSEDNQNQAPTLTIVVKELTLQSPTPPRTIVETIEE